MFKKLIVFLIVATPTHEFNISRQSEELSQQLGLCIFKFIHTFPKLRTLFMYNKADAVSNILYETQQPFVVINLKIGLEDLHRLNVYNSYIFSTDNIQLIESFLSKYYTTRYYNPEALTLIAFRGNNLQKLFDQLWKFYLINVIVVNKDSKLYTYKPISLGNCTAYRPISLGSCLSYNMDEMKLESKTLYFTNCKFRIYANVFTPYVDNKGYEKNTGFEMTILKEIVYRLRLDYKYMRHNYTFWGNKIDDGNYTMMLDELYRKKAEIILGGINFSKGLNRDFDPTLAHCYSPFSFFVPLAKPIKPWKNIFHIFDGFTWLCTFISLALTTVLWYHWKGSNDLGFELLYLVNMLVSAVSVKPKEMKLKIIFIVWAFCCLIIILFYQSPMVAFLTKPNYEYQISTVEDLVESNLQLGGFSDLQEFFDMQNDIYQEIYKRWSHCPLDGIYCMGKLFDDGDFAFIMNSRSMKYFQYKNENRRVFKIKNHRILFIGTMYMQKGSPFLMRFNSLILRLQQSGLMYKWDKYDNVKFNTSPDLETKPLKFDHFLGAIAIYWIGIGLSIVSFTCELIIDKLKKN